MMLLLSYRLLLSIAVVLQMQCALTAQSQRVDGTLEPNKSGASVVRAVITKINASEIFNESSWWSQQSGISRPLVLLFLRRMAYVETRDGQRQTGSRQQSGGIWNINQEVFNMIHTYVCGSSSDGQLRRNIKASRILNNTRWCDISYTDDTSIDLPMYSGLAAALYVDKLVDGDNLPLPTVNKLYMLWEHFGEPRGKMQWKMAVDKLKTKENCTIKSDVVFVIDSSISIIPHDYEMTKVLIHNFTNETVSDTQPNKNRVGIILIGTEAFEYLPLGERRNISTTLERIRDLPHLQGFTNTADGLCTLSRQEWREDGGVLKLAIVLTDGVSNRNSDNCDGNSTEQMANLMRTNNSDVLVFAIGVGAQINRNELEVIASRRHLTSRVTNYDRVPPMSETFHYQICYTMSAPTSTGNQENGTLAENEIMRWVLNGVGDEGVTVRLCVRDGGITLYVSQVATPNEEIHDSRSNIARTDKLGIVCETIFNTQYHTPGTRRPRSSEPGGTTSLYLSIEGHDEMNTFFMQSGDGNVTFDINECKQHPSPCHESALCYNTDGSFYCECRQGYKGDGFHCSSYLFELVAFLIPSVVLGVLLLLGFVLLAIVGIRLNYSAPKAPPKGKRVPTPFTSAGSCSATNPLAINTPA